MVVSKHQKWGIPKTCPFDNDMMINYEILGYTIFRETRRKSNLEGDLASWVGHWLGYTMGIPDLWGGGAGTAESRGRRRPSHEVTKSRWGEPIMVMWRSNTHWVFFFRWVLNMVKHLGFWSQILTHGPEWNYISVASLGQRTIKNHKAMWLENWGSKNTFTWSFPEVFTSMVAPQALKECETLQVGVPCYNFYHLTRWVLRVTAGCIVSRCI